MDLFCAKFLCLFVQQCFFFSSELILTIEIRPIDLIHLAHVLDPAAFQILLAILKMAMLVLIKISMILMISPHRMRVNCLIHGQELSVHPHKI